MISHRVALSIERVDVLAGSAQIFDPPAVCAAVQEMLTATRTEVSYILDLLKEKNVAQSSKFKVYSFFGQLGVLEQLQSTKH